MNFETLSHQTQIELNVLNIQNHTGEEEMIERAPAIQNQQIIQVAMNQIVPMQAF